MGQVVNIDNEETKLPRQQGDDSLNLNQGEHTCML